MAGKRRRGDGLPPRPKLRQVKAERRRERLAAELAAAVLPRQRLTVAVDYVRTCLQATGPRVPVSATVTTATVTTASATTASATAASATAAGPGLVPELVRELVEAGDQLWAVRRRARLHTEMADAATAGDRLSVALEYVRRALAGSDDPAVQQTADQVVEPLVRRLVAAGEQMHQEVT